MKTCRTTAVLVVVAAMVACLVPSSLTLPVDRVDETPSLLAVPADHVDETAVSDDAFPDAPFVEGRADRHARATCDLLSFQSKWVTPHHAACAAHCIGMLKGYKGGRCKNAVCHCRK